MKSTAILSFHSPLSQYPLPYITQSIRSSFSLLIHQPRLGQSAVPIISISRSSHSQPPSSLQYQRTPGIQLTKSNQSQTQSIISNSINQNLNKPLSISTSENQLGQFNANLQEPSISPSIIIPSSSKSLKSSIHKSSQDVSSNKSNHDNSSISQSHPTTRSTRRPTKQVINLTPKAIEHVSSLLDGPAPRLIRIGVKNKGCAGMAYNLEYVEQPGKFDEVVKTQNKLGKEIRILIDSRALFSIIGSTMDWQETKLGNKFVFDNPNIKEACGCGESFLV